MLLQKLKYLIYLMLGFSLLSCSKEPKLGGVWYDTNGFNFKGTCNPGFYDEVSYYSFEGDSVVTLRSPRDRNYLIDTLALEITNNAITIGDQLFSYLLKNDSLILELIEGDFYSNKIVLKKVNTSKKVQHIDKAYFSGLFSLNDENEDPYYKIDFRSDSTFQHSLGLCSGYPYGSWTFYKFNYFTFLDVGGLFPLTIINSVSDSEIVLSGPNENAERSYLKKIPALNKDLLVGEWIGNQHLRYEKQCEFIECDPIYELVISPDSLQLKPNGELKEWTLGLDEKHIYFPNSWEFEWELIEQSSHQLKIGIYDSLTNKNKVILFNKVNKSLFRN